MEQPYIIKYIQDNLPKFVMPNYRKVIIKAAEIGNNAGILGAAHLAMKIE